MVMVDANVLLDIATEDPVWCEWSEARLTEVVATAKVAINAVVYAEFSVHFDAIEAVEAALSGLAQARLAIPFEAAFLAGKAFRHYRLRGGTRVAPLPDFFIGAHAAVAGLPLLTRDPRRYRDYYPKLQLISPV